jgi:hypothetical protein
MAQTAFEAIKTFISVRHMREGQTFSFASMQIRYPHHDELRDALAQMTSDGLVEALPELQYKITQAGFTEFCGGVTPSEEDAIKAILDEIAARGLKPGKNFLWEPLEKGLHEKHLGPTELQPALEKLVGKGWLAAGMAPGFYKLTEAGFAGLK